MEESSDLKKPALSQMSTVAFEDLKITTMTLVIDLNGFVNIDAAFCLFPITRLELPPTKRKTKKCKIPLCDVPGSILSMRYRGSTRGIIRSSSTSHFKNSVTIDISTREKNLSVKLSSSSLHISGAGSVDQGKEATYHILKYATELQEFLEFMNHEDNAELKEQTFEWVKEKVRGNPVIIKEGEDLRLLHRMRMPEPELYQEAPCPEIAFLLLRQCQEYPFYENYLGELEGIASLRDIASPGIRILSIRKAMVNYNYGLGFEILRPQLARLFDGLDGFSARFDNAVEHSVTVETRYDPEELAELNRMDNEIEYVRQYGPEVPIPDFRAQQTKTRKKSKKPRVSFIIYQSGLVTQSGPDERLMKDPYERFNSLVAQYRDHIIKTKVEEQVPTSYLAPQTVTVI